MVLAHQDDVYCDTLQSVIESIYDRQLGLAVLSRNVSWLLAIVLLPNGRGLAVLEYAGSFLGNWA
jgi:hypothetical protein